MKSGYYQFNVDKNACIVDLQSGAMFVQVLLHDPDDHPQMLERGFKISPGFVTQVSITPTYVSMSTLLYLD